MRISYWSSDVCSSDLFQHRQHRSQIFRKARDVIGHRDEDQPGRFLHPHRRQILVVAEHVGTEGLGIGHAGVFAVKVELPAVEGAGEAVLRAHVVAHELAELGRASWRDSGCQYGYVSGVAVALKTNTESTISIQTTA